jgi:hypothetical protein
VEEEVVVEVEGRVGMSIARELDLEDSPAGAIGWRWQAAGGEWCYAMQVGVPRW